MAGHVNGFAGKRKKDCAEIPCLGCGKPFKSEGCWNRLCGYCQRRPGPAHLEECVLKHPRNLRHVQGET